MSEIEDLQAQLRELRERTRYLEAAHRSHIESLALLSSLGDFQSSIKDCRDLAKVLSIARSYIQRLMTFDVTGFAMVDDTDLAFKLADCEPSGDLARLRQAMTREIEEGTFAWALRQNHAVIIRKKMEKPLVLHVMATRGRVMGMFIGILSQSETNDVLLSMLSIILVSAAYALENSVLYSEISSYNQNLEEVIKRRTQELSRANEELIRARKLESVAILAGGIAHDFNNMLAVIMGNISLAKESVDPEHKLAKRLAAIEKASIRAKELTFHLLTFSKGGAPIKRTMSAAQLVRDSVSVVLKNSPIRWDGSIPDDLWPVEIDEGQIRQVISNVAINAMQSMSDVNGLIQLEGCNVEVKTNEIPPLKPGRYIRITIRDQGTGMPEEHLPKIFDPYFTTKPGRTGLGLAVAYSIIRKHDGHIAATSRVGEGSTFSIYLPASAKPSPKEEPPPSIAPALSQPQQTSRRVLLMDDEEGIREVTGAMLTETGHQVAFAINGTEAIDAYRQAKETGKPFDVVIMDLTIPNGMGGKEAIAKLLQIDPDIRAIVSSGYSNDPVMAEYTKHGFRAVLTKPYQMNDLLRMVQEVCRGDKQVPQPLETVC